MLLRDITVDATGAEHWDAILAAIDALDGVTVVDTTDRTFLLHIGGKIEQHNKSPLKTARRPLDGLHAGRRARLHRPSTTTPTRPSSTRSSATRWRSSATAPRCSGSATSARGGDAGDGGQGDALQGVRRRRRVPDLPGHEGPRRDRRAVKRIAPTSAGSTSRTSRAPRCFEIEDRLKAELDIPVFHDDQHGTAIVMLAALLNACKLTGRDLTDLRVLVIGLGAAGVAVTKILMEAGVRAHRRRRLARRAVTRARRLPRRLDAADQALVRRGDQPRSPRRHARRR